MSKSTDEKIDDLASTMAEGFASAEEKMATKDDLTKMATKDDLTKMATKDDLNDLTRMVAEGFASAEERMATKDDLHDLEQRMTTEIDSVRVIVGDIYSTVNRLEGKDFPDLKERVELLEDAVFPGGE